MRLVFVNLGSKLILFFPALTPFLNNNNIKPLFFTLNPKVRDIMRVMGVPHFPPNIEKTMNIPSPEFIQSVMNPVLEDRYPDKDVLLQRISAAYSALQDFIKQKQIDAFFVWNGSDPEGRVTAALAKEHGIPILFGENGYLPNTIQIDPQGINDAASVKQRITAALDHVHINPAIEAELKQRIHLLHTGAKWAVNKPKAKASIAARIASEFRNFSWDKVRRGFGGNRGIPASATLPERYIFIPFQVEADSQLILHSPLVSTSMEHFLDACYRAVQTAAPEYKLVVKLHPANLGRIDYAPLMKKYPDVLILKGGSVCELIEKSQAVITINSTVGFEALTYYKPVITLGNCIYNAPGVVHHAENLEQLRQLITTALSEPVSRKRIDDLLYYLYDDYFGHGSWKNHTPQSYQAVADKIAALLLKEKHGT